MIIKQINVKSGSGLDPVYLKKALSNFIEKTNFPRRTVLEKLRIKRKAVLLEIKKIESVLVNSEKNKQKLSNTIEVTKNLNEKLLKEVKSKLN